MKNANEANEAKALMQWANLHPICKKVLIAIPNGGSRHPLEAINLKCQGVKSGVSDYFLAYPVYPYGGMWIELKRAKPARSVISRNQRFWIELMTEFGYKAVVAYGWEEAKKVIEDYLNG